MKKTFEPHKLPLENLNWIYFLENIGSANRALAKFDGALKGIPNARVLLSPLTTKEAVLSSKIEGTQATLEEVLKFEAKPKNMRTFKKLSIIEKQWIWRLIN